MCARWSPSQTKATTLPGLLHSAMATSVTRAPDGQPLHRVPPATGNGAAAGVAGLVPMLYALNFAIALPPKAIMCSSRVECPTVFPHSHAIVSPVDLAS